MPVYAAKPDLRLLTLPAVEYQAGLRCDAWELVLPELVFAPRDDAA